MTTTKIEEELRRIAREFDADEVKLTFTNRKTGFEDEFTYKKENKSK